MKLRLLMFVVVGSLLAIACGNDKNGFKKAGSGLEYKFIKENPNSALPTIDQVVILNIEITTEKGDVLFSSAESGRKYLKKLNAPSHPGGSFEDAIAMMHQGDSAVFRIDAYNYYTYTEKLERLPDKVKKGDKLIFNIGLVEILSSTRYDDVLTDQYHKDEATEMQLLSDYLKRTNITGSALPSGLYYIEQHAGKGKQAVKGRKVKVHYTGTYIDGSVFDTSLDKSPIQFTLGNGEVIDGWEEGLLLMKEGGKARFIIPSKLAYGDKGKNEILPYTTLIFDVELISVQ